MNNDNTTRAQHIYALQSELRARKDALNAQLNALDKAVNTGVANIIEATGGLVKYTAMSVDSAAIELAKALKREAGNE